MRQGGRRAPERRGRGLAGGGPFPRPRWQGWKPSVSVTRAKPAPRPLRVPSGTRQPRYLERKTVNLAGPIAPAPPLFSGLSRSRTVDHSERRHGNNTGFPQLTCTSTVSSSAGPVKRFKSTAARKGAKAHYPPPSPTIQSRCGGKASRRKYVTGWLPLSPEVPVIASPSL